MKLYIIGNGFDIAHGLPTKYSNFKEYLKREFNLAEDAVGWDSNVVTDESKAVSYIIGKLDNCADGGWKDIEATLGCDCLFDGLTNDSIEVGDDTIEVNEAVSNEISRIFPKVKELFTEWVNSEISALDYSGCYKEEVAKVLDKDGVYLSLNYSDTLERVYGIDNVYHIHGRAIDSLSSVIFGHGSDEQYVSKYVEGEITLNELKQELRKDTNEIIKENKDFFSSLSNITEIYSYGFSFSDVDMPYVDMVLSRVSLDDVVWYINQYTAEKKPQHIKLLRVKGVNVKLAEW